MAYMNQEKKKTLSPQIKAVLKRWNVKASIGVRNHSTLVVNISQGPLDFKAQYESIEPPKYYSEDESKNWYECRKNKSSINVNTYYIDNYWTGDCKVFLQELKDAMDYGNHDRSDTQTDYYDVGWYTNINIGKWEKLYKLI